MYDLSTIPFVSCCHSDSFLSPCLHNPEKQKPYLILVVVLVKSRWSYVAWRINNKMLTLLYTGWRWNVEKKPTTHDHQLLRRENCFRSTPKGVLTAYTDGCWVWDCCIAVLPKQYLSGMWGIKLVVVGSRSSVVRALAAQASDLGSIPSDFPVSFFKFHLQPVYSVNILLVKSMTVSWPCPNIIHGHGHVCTVVFQPLQASTPI